MPSQLRRHPPPPHFMDYSTVNTTVSTVEFLVNLA